jgi:prolipoprotein diacylglyceryltransferase
VQWTGNLRVHFALEALGYLSGAAVYVVSRRRQPDVISDATRATILAGAAVGAALGTRLLFVLCEPARLADPASWLAGKTVVGGLLGGLIGVEIAKWMNGITRSTGDLFVYPLITAMCIGRIGCFLAGPADKTAGLPTTLPWGIAIADGVKRHPVAIYEIAFLLLLALALHFVRTIGDVGRAKDEGRRTKENSDIDSLRPSSFALRPFQSALRPFQSGDRFRLFLASYLAFRLAVDFLKPEPPPILFGLSAIQWACVAGLTYYGLVLSNPGRSVIRRSLTAATARDIPFTAEID